MIYKELFKKFKFNHTNKWYMHDPESVQENETDKLLWDFKIQTDHLTTARRSDRVIVNEKKKGNFVVPADHKVKVKESDNFLDLA